MPAVSPARPQIEANEPTAGRRLFLGWLLCGTCFLFATFSLTTFVSTDDWGTWWLVMRRFSEAWAAVGLLVVGLHHLPATAMLTAIGRGRSLLLGTIALLFMWAQYVPSDFAPYPFNPWTMYTTPISNHQGVDQFTLFVVNDGTHQLDATEWPRLPVARALPSRRPRPFMASMDILVRQHEAGDSETTDLLADTARLLAQQSGYGSAEAVAILSCEASAPTREQPATCRTVLTVPMAARTSS